MKRSVQLFLVCVLCLFTVHPGWAAKKRFQAKLSASEEVPAVKSDAKGDFKLTVYKKELSYELNAEEIMNPTAAHIHRGKKGENGPPIAGLFGGPAKEGKFSGVLAVGTITEKSLLGDFKGKSIADLVRLLRSGNAYVNIHTDTFPAGEIRGQIR